MRDAPPSWRPVGGPALLSVQPALVHQPAAVRDLVDCVGGRECAAASNVLNDGPALCPNGPLCYCPDVHAANIWPTVSQMCAEVEVPPEGDDAECAEEWGTPPDAPVLEVARTRPMQKLSRTMMRSFAARHLKTKQGGLCPLCQYPIDLTIKGEGVLDHDHDSGEIRGVLHRSCNAAEGKIANAAARWGAKSSSYAAIIAYLKHLVGYLEAPGAGLIYPMHKTPAEKNDAKNAKARANRAAAKAKLALRGRKTE